MDKTTTTSITFRFENFTTHCHSVCTYKSQWYNSARNST